MTSSDFNDVFDVSNFLHYDETRYDSMLLAKVQLLKKRFNAFIQSNIIDDRARRDYANAVIDDAVIIKSPTRYRQRCRFAIDRQNDGRLCYALWEGGKQCVFIRRYPIASITIITVMEVLLEYLDDDEGLNNGLKACSFLSTMQGEIIITLIYDIPLSDHWLEDASRLKSFLENHNTTTTNAVSTVNIIGRSKGVKMVVEFDFVYEILQVNGSMIRYKQVVDGFSNPNGHVNGKALEWICNTMQSIVSLQQQQHQQQQHYLLELFSGNSNHTCALSKYVDYIVAVELNRELCKAANENLSLNNIDNVKIVQCDSAKFAKTILKNKYYMINDSNNDSKMEFNIVLVDPPRAGLDPATLKLIVQYDYIIYVSCNPVNLIRDLADIVESHDITNFALFDHFAYTDHVECGVFLKLKKTSI